VKDNFVFGLREPLSVIDDKIPMEDHILSLEAKRKTDRRCEFWLEFENGVKMFAEMLDPAPAAVDQIPPYDFDDLPQPTSHRNVVIKESH